MAKSRLTGEALVKSAISDYLDHLEVMGKCVFNRLNSGSISHRVKGAKKGTADFECAFAPNGRHVSIEAKSERGKQEDDQIIRQKKVERVGGIYILAKSIRDVEDGLRKEAIL